MLGGLHACLARSMHHLAKLECIEQMDNAEVVPDASQKALRIQKVRNHDRNIASTTH